MNDLTLAANKIDGIAKELKELWADDSGRFNSGYDDLNKQLEQEYDECRALANRLRKALA